MTVDDILKAFWNWLGRKLRSWLPLCLILLLTACAGTKEQKTAGALLATQKAVVATADVADDLCTQGLLTQPECDDLKDLYLEAYVNYVTAEQALRLWLEHKDDSAWQTYLALRERFVGSYQSFQQKASSLGVLEFAP